MSADQIREFLLDQLYNLGAGVLYAAGISYFAKGANFAPGGLSGLALIINSLWGLPIGVTTLLLNLPLVGFSRHFLGRRFLEKTLVSMLYAVVFQDLVFASLPVYTGDALLAALFAGLTQGASLALLYLRGSSSGGTDFLTLPIKALRPHLSVGLLTGAIDVCVILLGWPVFGSVDAVLYGLLTTGTSGVMVDKLMYGSSSSKMLLIITDRGADVAQMISDDCDRGSTLLRVIGTHTGIERQMILCACARSEVYRIRMGAYRLDPKCLVMISEIGEVYGEGFANPQKKF